MGDTDVVTSTVVPLPSRLIGAEARVPNTLSDLNGPNSGRLYMPVRLVWSGPNDFDIADPKERLTLYRTLLDCGQRVDIIRYVNAELLCHDWPRIRRLTSRHLIAVWERCLPELAQV
jgi:hypothetical protein